MKRILVLLMLILCFQGNSVLAQDYKFHSIFIYNFTKYIVWPEEATRGNFVIGVLGKSNIKNALDVMAKTKKVKGNRSIKVVEYSGVDDIGNCHILFIPMASSANFDVIKAKMTDKPVLLITEKEGLGKKGSGINFVERNGKWRFELNRVAVEKNNLKVAKELTLLAILV